MFSYDILINQSKPRQIPGNSIKGTLNAQNAFCVIPTL